MSSRSIYNGLIGAEVIFKKLIQFGFTNAHMYSGGAIMSLIDQFHPSKNTCINYQVHTHEQNWGHAATGYAKAGGKCG